MRDIDTSKAAGFDRLPGRFLKEGVDVPAKPVTDTCNLSISLNKFPRAFKLAKVKHIFKKVEKLMFQITDLSLFLPILWKVIENVVHEQTTKFLNGNNNLVTINLASEVNIQQTYFYHFSMKKF